MRTWLLLRLAMLFKMYYRCRWLPAQEWIWQNWLSPHLLWRPLTLHARTFFGAKILCTISNALHARLYFFGLWEPVTSSYILSRLKSGDIFIDIGANVGYYSLLASRCVGPAGHVFAYEASPSVFRRLQENLALNHVNNVTARNVAITDRRREVPIYVNEGRLGESTILADIAKRIEAPREATIPGYPLGDVLDDETIRAARFIKIDVEGAEWLVVKGIQNIIPHLSDHAEIVIEINAKSAGALGGSAQQLLALFTKAGFSVFQIDNSYELGPYIRREKTRPRPYDGKPFVGGDFILRRERVEGIVSNGAATPHVARSIHAC